MLNDYKQTSCHDNLKTCVASRIANPVMHIDQHAPFREIKQIK